MFAWTGEWAGSESTGVDCQGGYFKKNNSQFVRGWVLGKMGTSAFTPLTKCSLYDIDAGFGNGVESVFKTRIAVSKHDSNGNSLGTLPANQYVLTKNATCGSKNPKLMHITAAGSDEEGPQNCDCFINVCAAGMDFNSFALKGTLR